MTHAIELTTEHSDAVRDLFLTKRFMGVDHTENYFTEPEVDFNELAYDNFCNTYLSGLKNYRAFGTIVDGKVTSYLASYESVEDATWYGTQMRSLSQVDLRSSLDAAIFYYESVGKYKFYSLFNARYNHALRRLIFSEYNHERYDYINEYIVPAKTKCLYSGPWNILFNRIMVPVDSIVRCSFLKEKYRPELTIGGNL